jgi:hypothetical protein
MKKLAALVLLISGFAATQLYAQATHSPSESGKPANKPEKTATKKEEKSGADNFLDAANAVNPNEPTTTEIYSDDAFFDSNKSMGIFSGRVKVTDPRFNLQSDKLTIYITSLSGVTGAGRKIEADYLFAECNESMRSYGVPKHRHLSEIEQELSIAAGEKITIQFTPHLVPVNRGIISTIYVDVTHKIGIAAIDSVFENAYGSEPFVRLPGNDRLPDTKNVVGTNFIDVAWKIDNRTGRLIVMSAIDNIVKGASGQAIQCFNLMRGFPETAGLL